MWQCVFTRGLYDVLDEHYPARRPGWGLWPHLVLARSRRLACQTWSPGLFFRLREPVTGWVPGEERGWALVGLEVEASVEMGGNVTAHGGMWAGTCEETLRASMQVEAGAAVRRGLTGAKPELMPGIVISSRGPGPS